MLILSGLLALGACVWFVRDLLRSLNALPKRNSDVGFFI